MRTNSKWAMKGAATGALVLLLAAPSFAQSRGQANGKDSKRNDSNRAPQTERRDDRGENGQNHRYRENQRVTQSGRVTNFTRERNGYRVQFENGGQKFWVPQATFGKRVRDLRAGVSISFGGIFRGGTIYVDGVDWSGNYGDRYNNDFVRGVVDRIDVRSGTLWLRDRATGRLIAADMRDGNRYSNVSLRGLRRGDYVELSGQWLRGGVFDVARVDNVSSDRNGRNGR